MRRILTSALFLLFAVSASGQTFSFGQPFPLTNTRYGTAPTQPKLRSNGEELFAFWSDDKTIRMTRVVDGARRGGLPVITMESQNGQFGRFDAVWTGTHFLVAASIHGPQTTVVTRAVSATGEILGPPIVVVARYADYPSLAFYGRTALLVYWSVTSDGVYEIHSLPLSADGRPKAHGGFVANGLHPVVAGSEEGFAALFVSAGGATLATFDAAGRLEGLTPFPLPEGVTEVGLAIASDGESYLALLTGLAEVSAVPFTAAREVGTALTVDAREPSPQRFGYIDAAATWNGTEWAVTYTNSDYSRPWQLIAATIDRAATVVTSREVLEQARSAGIAATKDRTVVARTSTPGFRSVPQLVDLPLAGNAPREFTFKAGDQILLASASSGDAVLVVWREWLNGEWSVRAGVRTVLGDWFERKLPDTNGDVLAASAGGDFLVVMRLNQAPMALRFDRQLRPQPQVSLPFMPDAVGSTGHVYALVAWEKALVLTPSGDVGEPVSLPGTIRASPAIASDGEGFLVAWIPELQCEVMGYCPGGYGILARRFDAAFRPLDSQNLILTEAYQEGPAVAWNGLEYVVAWATYEQGQFAATIPARGGIVSTRLLTGGKYLRPTSIRATRGGVVITARDTETLSSYIDRFVFLDASGNVRELEPFVHSGVVVSGVPRLESFADGRIAYLASKTVVAAPQHAATHVTMTLESYTPVPGAAQLTATVKDRNVKLAWTNAGPTANGYRVEYRIDDGAWNELEEWFGAEEREATFTLSSSGQRVAFRVRAWSDAGTGQYSAPVPVNAPRRRSVR
jgi:hypothetical protein